MSVWIQNVSLHSEKYKGVMRQTRVSLLEYYDKDIGVCKI